MLIALNSPWIWHLVLVPGNIYDCWGSRLNRLHPIFVITFIGIRLPWAYHQEEMSRRLRPN